MTLGVRVAATTDGERLFFGVVVFFAMSAGVPELLLDETLNELTDGDRRGAAFTMDVGLAELLREETLDEST
jgi:hypothetical protein